jgi:hypothetical protein
MVNDDKRVVWVLGTGFSQPLGGPMLNDLLSEPSLRVIKTLYSGLHLHKKDETGYSFAQRVIAIFQNYLKRPDAPFVWENAEAFLDYIDTAALDNDHPSRAIFAELVTHFIGESWVERYTPEVVRSVARQLISAQCCAFLKGARPDTEKWSPYHRWLHHLVGPKDTIITFNYDRVLEDLDSNHVSEGTIHQPRPEEKFLHFVVPKHGDGPSHPGMRARVLKLHGSTDWRREQLKGHSEKSPRVSFHSEAPEYSLTCQNPDEQIAIATPGDGKQSAVKELAPLWTAATNAISDAHSIVFMGYRFPPTDIEALSRLTDAIPGMERSDFLSLHTVLGPARNDATERLAEVLEYKTRAKGRTGDVGNWGHKVAVHRLYTQDFMTVFTRSEL